MKNKNKQLLYFVFMLGLGLTANAQVGVGTPMPDPSTQLHIESTDKGVLFPQVELTGKDDTTAITNGNINSLFIYNTVTAGTAPNDVMPGYYYWIEAESKWVRVLTTSGSGNQVIS